MNSNLEPDDWESKYARVAARARDHYIRISRTAWNSAWVGLALSAAGMFTLQVGDGPVRAVLGVSALLGGAVSVVALSLAGGNVMGGGPSSDYGSDATDAGARTQAKRAIWVALGGVAVTVSNYFFVL